MSGGLGILIANSIAILAVLGSALYAAWRLGPRTVRERLRVRLARYLPMLRLYPGVPGAAGRGGIGGCPDCGSCAPNVTQRE